MADIEGVTPQSFRFAKDRIENIYTDYNINGL